MNADELTIRFAQVNQPWVVPYSGGVKAAKDSGWIPHILATHDVLHAMKTVGKLAAIFERLDHCGQPISLAEIHSVGDMAADLVTAALRLANLYNFDLATSLVNRVEEKNGVNLLTAKTV